ncbi:XkdQ/YqbQ family protein [Clostridium estertheticum]|uniref:XkdQ/YqbQ family protein n=1 Tax=Clostridium estertheticum TaxID=238834 RepID=UPI00124DE845|nr:terminase [Clostridium estertheticum]MBZ9615288.1 terminase [Clostridium estertheticum subsp. laramiense]WAG75177.1 terminase [Clostridium estertheticum]
MISIYTLYNGVTTDITNVVKTISNTGDKSQVARKIDVVLAYSIWDRNQPRTQVGPGTKIWMLKDGKEIFRGVAWTRGLKSSAEELTFTAYDYLIYLTKSKVTFNFKNIMPEDATTKICKELGITVGTLASTQIKINLLIAQKTGYEAIMQVYTQASKKNGKKYIPVMDGTKLNVIEKGKVVIDYTLTTQLDGIGNNIGDVDYQDTLDNMINKVKVYNDQNVYVGEVLNQSSINDNGLVQDNYTKEADKNYTTVATGMLHGVDQIPTISDIIGNWGCRTGYAVKSKIFYLDILKNAVLYIEGDTHTWEVETEKYTMSLNLSFKNTMDSEE